MFGWIFLLQILSSNDNFSEMSIFSDERVRERIRAVLDNAGVGESDFEQWIRRPPRLTTLRVNSHRTSRPRLRATLEEYLDKVGPKMRWGRKAQIIFTLSVVAK